MSKISHSFNTTKSGDFYYFLFTRSFSAVNLREKKNCHFLTKSIDTHKAYDSRIQLPKISENVPIDFYELGLFSMPRHLVSMNAFAAKYISNYILPWPSFV